MQTWSYEKQIVKKQAVALLEEPWNIPVIHLDKVFLEKVSEKL